MAMTPSGAPEQRKLDFSKSKQALVRYHKGQHKFEIIVDPKLAFRYLKFHKKVDADNDPSEESEVPLLEILAYDVIYTDAYRGLRATDDELTYVFQNTDALTIARIILDEGELQLTQEQRDELAEKKRLHIINFIARNAIDPRTNYPHPPSRIENAMEYAKIKVDPFKSADSQIKDIIKALQEYLPMRLEQVTIAIRMPAEYGAKAYGIIKRYGEIKKEEWNTSGQWIGLFIMPAGRQTEFFETMESLTKGRAEIKVVERTKL